MAFKQSPLLVTLLVQTIVLLPSALIAWAVNDAIGLGWLLGSLVFVIPNAMFTLYTFRHSGADDPGAAYRSFKFGELVKLILTTIGMALAFKYAAHKMNVLAFFAGFAAMVLLQLYIAGKRLAKTL